MRLTCPCCGATHSIEGLLADAAARRAVAAALALPAGLGDRVLRYIGLFRPPARALSWDRAARLLEELRVAIDAGHVERDGRVYPAPFEYWRGALDQMLDGRERLALPLKTHGYLYEIIAGQSRRADQRAAERAEVADERARARQGAREGAMRGAAELAQGLANGGRDPALPSPIGRGDGGEGTAQQEAAAQQGVDAPRSPRPARRTPPPRDFSALASKLRGASTEEPTC